MSLFRPNPTNYIVYIYIYICVCVSIPLDFTRPTLYFYRSHLYFTRPTSILPGLRAGRGVRGLSREIGNGVLSSDWKANVPKTQTMYIRS